MPASGTARNTTMASAEVVARLAVAGCTPGNCPEILQAAMKMNKLPVSVATAGSGRPMISRTVVSNQLTVSLASAASHRVRSVDDGETKPGGHQTTSTTETPSDASIVSVTGNDPISKSLGSPNTRMFIDAALRSLAPVPS